MQKEISKSLRKYIEKEILPRYDHFDKAHRRDHAHTVIEQSIQTSRHYDVNMNMVYAIAAYHDTGLCEGRETHHTASAHIVRNDARLKDFFTDEEIETIAEAVEDHRASKIGEPRTIYGKIVAEADRIIDSETIIRRCIQYGVSHYPELSKDKQFERAYKHLLEKYGKNGYLKLWIPESPNAEKLQSLQHILEDGKQLHTIFDKIFAEETITHNYACHQE